MPMKFWQCRKKWVVDSDSKVILIADLLFSESCG